MAKRVCGIIGNIGAGKTTLGSFIASERGGVILAEQIPGHDLRYFHERVDEAAKELFYGDRERYTDELEIIQARLRVLRHTVALNHEGYVLFDRTLIEGSETFRRNSFRDGYLTHGANDEYDRLVKLAIDNLGRSSQKQTRWLESLLVYLKVEDPKILQERQRRRGDPLEKIIPVEYLGSLNAMYEKFIANIEETYGKWGLIAPQVLVLDGSVDMNETPAVLEQHTRAIAEKLRNMSVK